MTSKNQKIVYSKLILFCLTLGSLFIPYEAAANLKFSFANSSNDYIQLLEDLIDHINEDIILSDNDFAENHDAILQNIEILNSDFESIEKSFQLIEIFEEKIGPIFTTNNTRNGFNKAYGSDGLNIHRNVLLIYQGLIDFAFTEELLSNNRAFYEGRFFKSSSYFPGPAEGPSNQDHIEYASVKCDYLLGSGTQPWATIGNPNVVRPTGCYLAPGSIAEITVPSELVNKGLKIRVGAHFWDLENKSRYKRMDRVSILFDINSEKLEIAHPLGGGIYLEIPIGINEGIVELSLRNVIRAPFFSKKSFDETSLTEWQETERHHMAPWADFETDRFMMQVPTSWVYAFDDPLSLLENWDKSMDVVSDLLGRPRVVDRHKNYLQFDVIIRGSAYHPGYPMSNTPYDPNANYNGTPNHNILKGPQFGQDIHFHELGHEVAISKFVGEVEAIVNFLYVPVLNKCFGYSLGEAFSMSFGPSYNFHTTKDNTTKTRLVSDTFHEGLARNTCNCTKDEVRYQHRGYAHYVDIVELFGWEALEIFWQAESDAADMGMPFPVNNQSQDDRIFRMSKAAGFDLRPLFHFWGIHPNNQELLAQQMTDHDLKLPMSIKEKLHTYKNLIPIDYEEFVEFGNELYPDFLNYGGDQYDFGAGWYQQTAQTYDEERAEKIVQALSDIILFYYGTDCFELDMFEITDFNFSNHYCRSDEIILLPEQSNNGISGQWMPTEIDLTQTGEFQYTFYPNLDECTVENSVIIEVEEVIVNIDGDGVLCPGETTILSADSGFLSYTWGQNGLVISNEESVEIDQEGPVQLIVESQNGCEGEANIEIMVQDEIVVELLNNEYVVSGGTAPYQITVDTIDNVVTVLVLDDNGCEKSVDFILSNSDDTSLSEFRIYPNPVTDELIIVMDDNINQVESIKITSLDGKYLDIVPLTKTRINVSSYAEGIYLLQIQLKSNTMLIKRFQKID